MNIDSKVSLCSDKNFIVNVLAKAPFFRKKILAVPFYKGTEKHLEPKVYSVAMLSFVKGTSAECQPLPLMHRVVIRVR